MNLNDRVRVTLTEVGLVIWQDFYRETKLECNNLPYWDGHIERTERVLETQLWHLMEVFGPTLKMGTPNFFTSNEIEILKEY